MSPLLPRLKCPLMDLRKEARWGRIEMSKRELRRVEVLARVKSKELKLTDAPSLLGLSHRQVKRLWSRYRQEGAADTTRTDDTRSGARTFSRVGKEKRSHSVLSARRRGLSREVCTDGRRTFLEFRGSHVGKLVAMDVEFMLDGAYTTFSSVVLPRGTIHGIAAPELHP